LPRDPITIIDCGTISSPYRPVKITMVRTDKEGEDSCGTHHQVGANQIHIAYQHLCEPLAKYTAGCEFWAKEWIGGESQLASGAHCSE
jgi:hypothetical protein